MVFYPSLQFLHLPRNLPGDFLGDSVLDLKPGVDLHEVVIPAGRFDQELDCSGVGVADTLAQVDCVSKNSGTNLKTIFDK